MRIKAISIKEPWASAIMKGEKTVEQRTWNTNYRGDLLLVASKSPQSPIAGKAFAICKLVDCRPMTEEDAKKALVEYDPGTYAWVLENVKRITPFGVRGQLGLYDVRLPIETRMSYAYKLYKRGNN